MITPINSPDSGQIEFRQAILPDDLDALMRFDRLAFHAHLADLFSRDEWEMYESYWMELYGNIVGCTALQRLGDELWIASTAIDPAHRRKGLGAKMKQWQIRYAESHGYRRVGTVSRVSNVPIIALNEQFGFVRRRVIPHRYSDPDEPGIEMELRLPYHGCPRCGRALRTPRAKQCRYCGADWHSSLAI